MGRQTTSPMVSALRPIAAAAAIGLALVMAPVKLSADSGLDVSSAAAKSNKSKGNAKSGGDRGGGKSSGGSQSTDADRSQNNKAGGSPSGSTLASASNGGGNRGGSGAIGKPKRADWSKAGLQQHKEDLASWKAEKQIGPNLASRRGALNAAHASPTALLNAAPNSRVGLIAIYKNSVEAGSKLKTEYDEAVAARDSLEAPDSTTIEAFEQKITDLEAELVAATAEGATDTRSPEEIDADLLAAAQELEDYKAGFTDYYAAADEVESLTAELEASDALIQSSLEDAANKPVDEEVQQSVNELLGL